MGEPIRLLQVLRREDDRHATIETGFFVASTRSNRRNSSYASPHITLASAGQMARQPWQPCATCPPLRHGRILGESAVTDVGPDQLPIELILLRQVASYLEMPIFLVDATGSLVYFNEPAEPLLGCRFDEIGEMAMADWLAVFRPTWRRRRRPAGDQTPLVVALTTRRPVHATLEITGVDRVRRPIEVTAFPLGGGHGRLVGAIAIFWPATDT
jgi:PAS domain-containing protein